MKDTDIHDISGAYAVDAVDDVERARSDAHVADCSPCKSEVTSLKAAATALSLVTPVSPPASLRSSVLLSISQVRPLPPVVDPIESPTPLDTKRAERARRNPARWLVSVAAAAVIITGGAVWQPWSPNQEQGNPALTATQQVLQAKDAQRFEGKVGTGTATVVRSSSLKKAVIVTANLPAAPQGKVYQLWLQRGTEMVPAGFVPNAPTSTVLLQGDVTTASGAGITIEPAGGSPTPSLPPKAVIEFV